MISRTRQLISKMGEPKRIGVCGWTSENGRVTGKIFDINKLDSGEDAPHHMQIASQYGMTNADWRWRFKDNTIYWWEPPPQDVKSRTKSWLRRKGLTAVKSVTIGEWFA